MTRRMAKLFAALGALVLVAAGEPDLDLTFDSTTPVAFTAPADVPGSFEVKVGDVVLSRESVEGGLGELVVSLVVQGWLPEATVGPARSCSTAGTTIVVDRFVTRGEGTVILRAGANEHRIPVSVATGQAVAVQLCGASVTVGQPSAPSDEPRPPEPNPSPAVPCPPPSDRANERAAEACPPAHGHSDRGRV